VFGVIVAVDVAGCFVKLGLDVMDGVITALVIVGSDVKDGLGKASVGSEECMPHPDRIMENIRMSVIQAMVFIILFSQIQLNTIKKNY
jgi:hypothetical protein